MSACPQANDPAASPASATRRVVSEVASLNSDSPSRTVITRRGSPTRRPTATAATASGGATIAPSASAAANGRPGTTAGSTSATENAVMSTMPNASWRIGWIRVLIAITPESTAAAYSSGGMMTVSTSSGFTAYSGTPGMNDTANPTTSRTIGGDARTRWARLVTSSTPTTRPITGQSSCMGAILPGRRGQASAVFMGRN